ncbi:MAG: sigma-70 family RNA polymerase sigma factor, partial [Nannocystaceae bacterium]|nr:sigma-70 family RNA polymerase sigma factor [Nannocystaceae bacterium]
MTAVADVLREFEGCLQRAICGYSAPGAERDDLSQQVALALVQALPRFRSQCSMKTYVLRIAHNSGMTFVRRRRKLHLSDVGPCDT